MTDINELRAILKRLATKTYTYVDLEILCQALETRQIILATGERAIAVGGDVTDAVFITGNGNLVYIFRETEAEVVRQIVQDTFKSFKPSALLTHSEFSKSAVAAAERLTGYWEVPVGRDELIAQIKSLLVESTDAIVLHGGGGIGKTRLLLELPKLIPCETSLRYVRTRAESIEYDLTLLDRNSHHVIVVDDAHRFKLLHQLGEVLVNPDLAGKVTLVLATRSVFKDSVTYQLGLPAGYQVKEIEVEALTNLDIDQLLQTSPYKITDEDTRHAIVRLAKGEPLTAGITARLVQRGESIIELNRDDVLTRYLNDIIRDLAEAGYGDRYTNYLELLAALGTLDLSNQSLREKVQLIVGISQSDEDCIVQRLVEAGLVDRYWTTLKIASEVLADHILIQNFFQTKRADYQKKIIEPFFALKPKQILTTLAEAEVKGECQAGLLLGQKLQEIRRILNQEDNIIYSSVLEWIKDLAYLRPKDALLIVDDTLDKLEKLSESPQLSYSSGNWDVRYQRLLLTKIVDILSRTYWSCLRSSIDYLYKLAKYRAASPEYAQVREEATKKLIEIADIKVGKPYDVQLTILNKIEEWMKEEFASNLELILSLIQPMFSMEIDTTKTDPTKHFHIIIRQGVLAPSESLRQIREQASAILYRAYNQASSLLERLKIVKALEGAILFPRSTDASKVPSETWAWLEPDCQKTARFLLDKVIPQAELPVLDAVAQWLWYAPRFSRYQLAEFEQLKQQLKNNKLYQLYRVLVSNGLRGDSEDEPYDWKVIEQRYLQAIKQYIEGLSPATIKQAIYDLETIVQQCLKAGESSTNWLDILFYQLAEKHPNLAQQLIEQTLSENLSLKHYLGHVVGGLYQNEFGVAWSYIKYWADSDDAILWFSAAKSYHFRDWSQFQDEEWKVLHHLVAKKSLPVDCEIIKLISRFALLNPKKLIDLLKILANRGDETILLRVAEALSASFESFQGSWGQKFISSEDFLEIIQNFERLPRFDYAAEKCLNRLGQIAPIQLIDFIERRLIKKAEQREKNEYYEVIHFPYSRAMESIRSSLEYPDVLRRVRNWMLREDFWFYETPDVLKEIAGSLEEPLYSILMEWIESGDTQKIGAVARILQSFNSGQLFYSLCREIISCTKDETVLNSIRTSIYSTPGAIFLGSGFSIFYRERLKEISPWLEDENLRVSFFAQEMQQSLQQDIDRELAHEEFEERNW